MKALIQLLFQRMISNVTGKNKINTCQPYKQVIGHKLEIQAPLPFTG
jgi:hypothetical protein